MLLYLLENGHGLRNFFLIFDAALIQWALVLFKNL